MLNKPDPHDPPEDRAGSNSSPAANSSPALPSFSPPSPVESGAGDESNGQLVSRSATGMTPVRRHLRGVPSSRAYWELRADQMMNRIFDADDAIDLEGDAGQDGSHSGNHRPEIGTASVRRSLTMAKPSAGPSPWPRQTVLLLTTLGGVCMVSAASTLLYLNHWNQTQQALQQERNLLLVERLRELGPANPSPVPPPHASQLAAPAGGSSSIAALPPADTLPPPPDEAWIEQLDQLPPSPPPSRSTAPAPSTPARVLRVPVSPRLPQAAPPAAAPPMPVAAPAPAPRAQSPSPLLVGVVGAPGQPGSAIFQVGSSSTSVTVGEPIGSSGWRLRSADGDTAVIERGGEVRQVSIGNGK